MLVVRSKIKDVAKDFNVASDLPEALNKIIENMIKEACVRARENQRRTVMAKDLSLNYMNSK